ncbi:MAG: hypothetical protein IJ679_13070 [Lachnospiraceae bacterium]|nr:hypothetical protein [Lachnospiraceae bacterium]
MKLRIQTGAMIRWLTALIIITLSSVFFVPLNAEAARTINLRDKYAADTGKTFVEIKAKYGWTAEMGQNNAGHGALVDFTVPGTGVCYYFFGNTDTWKVEETSNLSTIEGTVEELFKGVKKDYSLAWFVNKLSKQGAAEYDIIGDTGSPYLPEGSFASINYTTKSGKVININIKLQSDSDLTIYRNAYVQIR